MESHSVSLKHKPGAALRVSTYFPGGAQGPLSNALVVFLNGLGLPRAAWSDAVGRLLELRKVAGQPTPALFCYDRYGQGESEPDPTDPPGTPYGHDARAVIADLHELLNHVADNELRTPLAETRLVFVCNSIGCALARLYAAEHPGRVEAFLFLDPMVANSDFVSLIPDPDAPGFDSSRLPAHVSVDDLRYARAMVAKTFLPTVPNGERFDRRRLADLLPGADKPILPDGPGGKTPRLVVAGHDWDEFAEQCKTGPMALPIPVVNAYVNPAWGEYNEGLTRLVQHESRPGGQLKIAKGCGHFIQKDDPQFVAIEIDGLLKELAR
ncbi:Alpha/beta hydrolase fold-1 [Lasiosphaeria miniovina]|uniref:Alpha/beta hydrolase fold-1 n=1 Tax=Lasiosphaeria miniovina TaxID=1954250 RepID=A0AA39ZUF3_9PEZI|nr:Alpha/beta hydrolase fold-1 [Lasiosphaeria miniovina]KAK0703858.1 Alpha/beta hydrolase fold-1 [Lasiosphaeria miniovina]